METPRACAILVARAEAKSCSGAAIAVKTLAGRGTIVASSTNGNSRVWNLCAPQKVQVRPASNRTKETRDRKNSAARLPKRKVKQANATNHNPRLSRRAGQAKVT